MVTHTTYSLFFIASHTVLTASKSCVQDSLSLSLSHTHTHTHTCTRARGPASVALFQTSLPATVALFQTSSPSLGTLCVCFFQHRLLSLVVSESLSSSSSHTLRFSGLSLPWCPFCLKRVDLHIRPHSHPAPSPTLSPPQPGLERRLTLRQGHTHLQHCQQVLDITLDALGNAWVLRAGAGRDGERESLLRDSGVPTPALPVSSPGSSRPPLSHPSACPGAPAR